MTHEHGRGSTDVPTFLVTTDGSRLTVFAFEAVKHDEKQLTGAFRPHLNSGSIYIGTDAPFIPSQPVYRNGKIYLAGYECAGGGQDKTCVHRVRVIVIPVFRREHPTDSTIFVSREPALGFANFTLGDSMPPEWILDRVAGTSLEIPAVDVNKDDDFVVLYDRAVPGFSFAAPSLEPGVVYSVFYTAEHARRDGILRQGTCAMGLIPICPPIPSPIFGHLDVAGICIDPSDDTTVWVSHGFGDGSIAKYRMVIGKVVPRGTYVAAQPHQK